MRVMPLAVALTVAGGATLAYALLAGRSADAAVPPDSGADPLLGAPQPTGVGTTRLLTLQNQAFPNNGHYGALIHAPPGFRSGGPFDLVVYFHGHNNCAENVSGNTRTRCTPGQATRGVSNLIGQFDAVNPNALLVVPQLRWDAATGDPGRLRRTDGLRLLLEEAFAAAPEILRGRTLADVRKTMLAAHSGGYVATAASLRSGNVPVGEVVLFDAMYGDVPTFERFAATGKFTNIYTNSGGTASNSRELARTLQSRFPGQVRWDDTTGDLTDADYAARILVKRTSLGHGSVPSYYFGRVLAHADLMR